MTSHQQTIQEDFWEIARGLFPSHKAFIKFRYSSSIGLWVSVLYDSLDKKCKKCIENDKHNEQMAEQLREEKKKKNVSRINLRKLKLFLEMM